MESSIRATDLGKMYKLYGNPADKALDALGLSKLLFWRKATHQEFWALRNFTFSVARGERLGLIGRNGAGKSTFLKIVAGLVASTEGTLEVRGRVQALLTLGTGFHPEFTGRNNIRASLAYQGLSPSEIRTVEPEIIDFAEIEEFIDQPIKTYSAGMYARLAFATATAIKPEILIIDEVLGAGDAYFAGKCIDRMKRLTHNGSTTVLFVSHDMSAVEMLCDRAVWIERGAKHMESSTADVSKAYARMVRERTEQRLKAVNATLAAHPELIARKVREQQLQWIVRFVHQAGEPIEVSRVSLTIPTLESMEVNVGAPQDNAIAYDCFTLIDGSFSQWGVPKTEDGGHCRAITTTPALCSAVVFKLDGFSPDDAATLTIDWRGTPGAVAAVEINDGQVYHRVATLTADAAGTQQWAARLDPKLVRRFLQANGLLTDASVQSTTLETGQGSIAKTEDSNANVDDAQSIVAALPYRNGEIFKGDIIVTRVAMRNGEGKETFFFQSFETCEIDIDYQVLRGPIPAEFVICVHRMGVIAMQSLSQIRDYPNLVLEPGSRGRCTLSIPSLPLGKGRYLISVAIFPRIDYGSQDTEKTAYVLHDRRYEIEVQQPEEIAVDLGMCRAPMEWRLTQDIVRMSQAG